MSDLVEEILAKNCIRHPLTSNLLVFEVWICSLELVESCTLSTPSNANKFEPTWENYLNFSLYFTKRPRCGCFRPRLGPPQRPGIQRQYIIAKILSHSCTNSRAAHFCCWGGFPPQHPFVVSCNWIAWIGWWSLSCTRCSFLCWRVYSGQSSYQTNQVQ